jgi:uncharacterized protein (TIGR00251 family)
VSRGFLVPTGDGVIIKLRVSPCAKRSSIEGAYGDDALKLRVAAPPVDGKANVEAERFLAKMLGVPHSEVAVVRGASGRDKALLVRGAAVGEIREALSGQLP